MPTVGHLQLLASVILPQSAWPMLWGTRTLHPHSLSEENLAISCNCYPLWKFNDKFKEVLLGCKSLFIKAAFTC